MSAVIAILVIAVLVGALQKQRRDRALTALRALRGDRRAVRPSGDVAPAHRSRRPPSRPIWARSAPPPVSGDRGDRRPGQSARDKAQEERERRRAQQAAGEPVTADPRPWDEGAKGQEEVGLELLRLPAGEWLVLHDIPVGHHGANIDHLVVGPGGVFSLNTKRLGGAV